MSVTINDISFVTTALATAGVIGICVYGLVRCAKYWRLFTGIALLLLIPLWFFFQFLLFAVFDDLTVQGVTKREWHFDYAVTPVLNLAALAGVWFIVSRVVKMAAVSYANHPDRPLVATPDSIEQGRSRR